MRLPDQTPVQRNTPLSIRQQRTSVNATALAYHRSVRVTTMSNATANSPRAHQLVAPVWHVVSAPYRSAISVGSGSTDVGKSRHQTMNVRWAAAALPSVIGGPG